MDAQRVRPRLHCAEVHLQQRETAERPKTRLLLRDGKLCGLQFGVSEIRPRPDAAPRPDESGLEPQRVRCTTFGVHLQLRTARERGRLSGRAHERRGLLCSLQKLGRQWTQEISQQQVRVRGTVRGAQEVGYDGHCGYDAQCVRGWHEPPQQRSYRGLVGEFRRERSVVR